MIIIIIIIISHHITSRHVRSHHITPQHIILPATIGATHPTHRVEEVATNPASGTESSFTAISLPTPTPMPFIEKSVPVQGYGRQDSMLVLGLYYRGRAR